MPKKFFAQTHPYLPYARATFLGDSRASRGVKKRNWNISRSLYSYALKFSAFILLNEIFQMRPFSYPGELNKSRFWIFNFFGGRVFIGRKKSEAGGLFQKKYFFLMSNDLNDQKMQRNLWYKASNRRYDFLKNAKFSRHNFLLVWKNEVYSSVYILRLAFNCFHYIPISLVLVFRHKKVKFNFIIRLTIIA